jgi:hypothetical protein
MERCTYKNRLQDFKLRDCVTNRKVNTTGTMGERCPSHVSPSLAVLKLCSTQIWYVMWYMYSEISVSSLAHALTAPGSGSHET